MGHNGRLRNVKVTPSYEVGDRILIDHGKAFVGTVKCQVYKSSLYGPCTITIANHRLYKMETEEGCRSRTEIFARRLQLYHCIF